MVTFRDYGVAKIIGIGNIDISPSTPLEDVLFVDVKGLSY